MVPPYCSFHSQTRSSNSSRPRSRAVDAFLGQLALHHHLGGDAGVVGAGQPERVVAEHAMPADGDVDLGVLEHVADVERAGDVGRRNDERKYAAAGVSAAARKMPESIHHCAQCGSNRWGSYTFSICMGKFHDNKQG